MDLKGLQGPQMCRSKMGPKLAQKFSLNAVRRHAVENEKNDLKSNIIQ